MNILWLVIKFLVANLLLVSITSTLIGFIIRGVLQPRLSKSVDAHKSEWSTISPAKGFVYSIGAFCISVFIIISLVHYTNSLVTSSFLVLMLTRVKDLISEVRTGLKTTSSTISKTPLDFVVTLSQWMGFIIFNYGLYLLWLS